MTKREQLFNDFKERRKREAEERVRLLREKYSKLSETEIAELFDKAMEQLSLEGNLSDLVETDEPIVKKRSILDDPKQRRFFEGMGTILKVKGDDQGESE